MKIMLAVDGSAFTKKMLAYLVTHDQLLSPQHDYTIVTVHPPVPPRVKRALAKEMLEDYYSDECEAVLSPVSKFLVKHTISANSVWKVGAVGETLSAIATKGGFDLLVMGSHGRSHLANMVMGSVASQVLANTSIPVLLVR